jgi:hypothetical protein
MSKYKYNPLKDSYGFLSIEYQEKNKNRSESDPQLIAVVLEKIDSSDIIGDLSQIENWLQTWKEHYGETHIKLFTYTRYIPHNNDIEYYLLGERLENDDELKTRIYELEQAKAADKQSTESREDKKKLRKRNLYDKLKKEFEDKS